MTAKEKRQVVHTYSLNGYNIAIDGGSGSIHVLDPVCYDILKDADAMPSKESAVQRLSGKYGRKEVEEACAELSELVTQNVLFSDEEQLISAASSKEHRRSVKALCLNISHDCNLRCEYCFASKGDYSSERELMSAPVAKKALDFLVDASDGRRNVEIDFFGGEPLMNFDVVKETVAYGRGLEDKTGKRFHFTITTNGTLLDSEKIDFINRNMDNVVISIDGRRAVHDAMRRDRAGRGSYDRILPLAKELVAGRNGKSYFIRGTFTAQNLDFSEDVMHLADLGFKEISVEPVVGKGSGIHLTREHLPALLNEYETLALRYIDRISRGEGFRFYHFNINIYDGPCLFKRIAACGAGCDYLAVAPDGTLYPCHQFDGIRRFALGDVFTGIKNAALCDAFAKNSILTKERCRSCWAKLFCSGGCHANAYFSNGCISEPDAVSCALQKKRIECAVMIQAYLAGHGEEAGSASAAASG